MFRQAIAVIAIFTSTSAYGLDQSQMPLSPGRPADIKKAGIISVDTENTIIITGAALLLIGVAVFEAKHGTTASAAPATTTSTTP